MLYIGLMLSVVDAISEKSIKGKNTGSTEGKEVAIASVTHRKHVCVKVDGVLGPSRVLLLTRGEIHTELLSLQLSVRTHAGGHSLCISSRVSSVPGKVSLQH